MPFSRGARRRETPRFTPRWRPPATTRPRAAALSLIRCGDATDDYAFVFDENCLDEVLKKVPSGRKVAVVSVVGAFRTASPFYSRSY